MVAVVLADPGGRRDVFGGYDSSICAHHGRLQEDAPRSKVVYLYYSFTTVHKILQFLNSPWFFASQHKLIVPRRRQPVCFATGSEQGAALTHFYAARTAREGATTDRRGGVCWYRRCFRFM